MLDGMNEPPGYSNPYQSFGEEQATLRQTAAVMVWITGGVCIGMFGLCATALSVLAVAQPAEIMSQMPPEQIETMQTAPWLIPAFFTVLFVLPGAALLILGFAVRAGKRGPTIATIVILWALNGFVSLFLLVSILAGVFSGNIADILVNLMVFGWILAIMLITVTKVHIACFTRPIDYSDEPWNSHLA